MKVNKTVIAGIVLLIIMTIFAGCTEAESSVENTTDTGLIPLQTYEYSANDLNDSWDEDNLQAEITLDDENTKISGDGARYNDGILTIDSAGVYLISGSLRDGQIQVAAGEKDDVQIVLNGVSVTNKDGPAFYEKTSDKVILTLAKDSLNTLTDGSNYADTGDSAPDAAVYGTHDLSINGAGELVVNGNYSNGIGSQDDLAIVGSKVTVTAENNAIKGRDVLAIKDGDITATSNEDGLKSNNDSDPTKGFIQIDGGNITVESVNDGIQAETNLIINDGNINVTTTGTNTDGTESMKALKAVSQIAIKSGTFSLDSTDDAIHADGNVTIDGGNFEINTDDDGIHADYATVINDGTMNIVESYEGIEGETVEINGGDISITASNDGINAAGGSTDEDTSDDSTDTETTDDRDNGQGPMGQDDFGGSEANNENNDLTINDGNVTIVSQGDGLDSNGDLYIKGGTITVSTLPNGAEGPIDANGGIYLNGGVLTASGNTSMAESPANDSEQNSLVIVSSTTMTKGSTVYVTDSEGNVIVEHTPESDYQMLILSSGDLKEGETYTVSTGKDKTKLFDVTISQVNTIVDNSGQTTQLNGMGGGGGQPQNNQPPN